MRVLYFAPTSTLYGDNIALLNILSVFVKKGIEPYIITSRKGDFTAKLDELGYGYSTMNFGQVLWPKLNAFRDYLFFLPRIVIYLLWFNSVFYLFFKLRKIIREFKPNLIHTNNSCVYTGILVAKLFRIKHVQHIREFTELSFNRKYFPFKKYFLRKFNQDWNNNIFITKGVKDLWNVNLSVSNRVIYDGVFSESFFLKKGNNKKPYFLYVGRLVKDKGVLELLKEFYLFCQYNDDINLKIVGSGDEIYQKEIELFVSEKKISNRVEFLGYRRDVYDLMGRAMAVFIPSYYEGFCFIPVEATINGTLVVARNTTGIKEQFENGLSMTGEEIGFRFNEYEEISTIMKKIVEKGVEYYYPMIERAQRVVKLYTIENSAESVYNYYCDILKN